LFVQGDEKAVEVWATTGERLQRVVHPSPRGDNLYSAVVCGDAILAGCRNGVIRRWERESGRPLSPLEGLGGARDNVDRLHVYETPEGMGVVAAGAIRDVRRDVRVWNAGMTVHRSVDTSTARRVRVVTTLEDGVYLMTQEDDLSVRLFRLSRHEAPYVRPASKLG
jgi:hypothetical protein